MAWLQQTFTPRTADENLRRQGYLVIIVAVALTILSLILGVNALSNGQSILTTIVTLAGTVLYIACIMMARAGMVRPAAYLITWVPCIGIFLTILATPNPIAIVFLAIPILLTSIVLPSLQVFPISLFSLLVMLYAVSRVWPTDGGVFISAIFFNLMIGGLAYLSARSVENALDKAQRASRDLATANQALKATNTLLEDRVAQRTEELQQREQRLQQALADLQQTLDDLRRSQETIQQLSAPILPVAPGVLVAPLIGTVDDRRVEVLMSGLLSETERTRARYLIIDITGIPVIDTYVAQALIHAADAVRMLGAQVIITGIRPEVAQTLVALRIDLGQIVTLSTLQSGVAEAVARQTATVAHR